MCKYIIELCSLGSCDNRARVTREPCLESTRNPFPHFEQCSGAYEEVLRASALPCPSCKAVRVAQNAHKRRGVVFSEKVLEGELFLPRFPPSPTRASSPPKMVSSPPEMVASPPPSRPCKKTARHSAPAYARVHSQYINEELFLIPEEKGKSLAAGRDSNSDSKRSQAEPRPLELPRPAIHPLQLNPHKSSRTSSYQPPGEKPTSKRDSSFIAFSPAQIPRHFGESHKETPLELKENPIERLSFRERVKLREKNGGHADSETFELPALDEVRRMQTRDSRGKSLELKALTPPIKDLSRYSTGYPQKDEEEPGKVSHRSHPISLTPGNGKGKGEQREYFSLAEIPLPATSFTQMEAAGTNLSGAGPSDSDSEVDQEEGNFPIQNPTIIPSLRRYSPLRFEGTILDGILF
ncbi:hypothetical protein PVAG01_10474 [Phlyctema vagabunda]|uniref:Uncharacterized protein n=1 Tax=Phlyctema vagabunda TaxID=108571 RepID=A0ABR4P627_9HELO